MNWAMIFRKVYENTGILEFIIGKSLIIFEGIGIPQHESSIVNIFLGGFKCHVGQTARNNYVWNCNGSIWTGFPKPVNSMSFMKKPPWLYWMIGKGWFKKVLFGRKWRMLSTSVQ